MAFAFIDKWFSKSSQFENLKRWQDSPLRNGMIRPAGNRGNASTRARLLLETLEDREVPAVVPVVSLAVNSSPFIGSQNVPVSITFMNPSATGTPPGVSTAPGFGPWVYSILPASGTDGDDGISFAGGATFLGTSITPTLFTVDGTGTVTGPSYAIQPSGAPFQLTGLTEGDQVVFFQLPYISYSLNQPGGTITFNTNVSELADESVALTITGGGGFGLGADPLNNPATDPPILAATVTATESPKLFTVEKVFSGPEQETATGPNFVRSYTVNVRVAPGQTIDSFQLADILAPGMQFIPGSITTTTPNFTGTAGTTAGIAVGVGTVEFTNGSNAVVGTGTAFTTFFSVGQSIRLDSDGTFYTIQSITDDNNLTLTANYTGTTGSGAYTGNGVTPGGTVVANFSSITGDGDDSTVDASFTFDFFVPRVDANNTVILPPTTGAFRPQTDEVTGTGNWTPIDTRDPAGPVTSDPVTDTFVAKSVAIQKGVTVVGGNGLAQQNAVLQYTIDFQMSDYFAFTDFQIPDLLPDGVRFLDSFTPTLTLSNPNGTGHTGTFSTSNFYVGGTRTGSFVVNDYNADGTQTIWFDVSNEIGNSPLLGGWIPTGGTGGAVPDPTDFGNNPNAPFGPLVGTITFRAQIQNNYSVIDGGTNVKQGDSLTNVVPSDPADIPGPGVPGQTVGGEVLNNGDLTGTGNDQSDNTSATVTIRTGSITKTIYAINGVVGTYDNPVLQDGDTVTYRLTYVLPTGSAQNFTLTDYLPLPVHLGINVPGTSFTTPQTAAPPVATATYGPGVASPPPGVTLPLDAVDYGQVVSGQTPPTGALDLVKNTVTFTFPSPLQDPLQRTTFVDIIFTVSIQDVPLADGYPLSNQGSATEGNTVNTPTQSDTIVQVTLGRPNLTVTKGVVGTSNPNGQISPDSDGGVTFNGPNSATPFSVAGGPLNSNGIAAEPVTGNISEIDADDLVQFAVIVENTGSGPQGAYDVIINDTKPDGFSDPTTGLGLNLQFRDGTGAGGNVADAIAAGYLFFDSVGTSLVTQGAVETAFFSAGGLRISGSGPTAPGTGSGPNSNAGVIDPFNPSNGQNLLVITYDLRAETPANPTNPNPVNANQTYTNTATVTSYLATPGGQNFAPTNDGDLDDDAIAVIAPPTITKDLVRTSIEDSTNGRNQAVIGEIITYTVTVNVPDGVTNNLRIIDTLDAGLAFRQVTAVNVGTNVTASAQPGLGAAPANVTVAPLGGSGGRSVTFNFGNVSTLTSIPNGTAANNTLTITYEAVVLNTSGNNRGDQRNNSAIVRYTNAANTVIFDTPADTAPNVRILEPVVNTTKSYTITGTGASTGDGTSTGIGQFGNTVTYTITLTNPTVVVTGGTPNTTTAYDVTLRDVLPTADITFSPTITYVSGPAAYTAANFTISGGILQTVAPLTSLLPVDLTVPGEEAIVLSITGTINGGVTPNELIGNTANTAWSSLPGTPGQQSQHNANAFERTGVATDPGELNDYRTSATANFRISVPNPVKSLVTTSESSTTGNNVAVGEVATYRLQVTVPRSTLNNTQLIDTLGADIAYLTNTARVSFVSNPAGAITSSTISGGNLQQTALPDPMIALNDTNSIALTAVNLSGSTLTFSLGDLLNTAPDSNTGIETIIVEFQALVLNTATNINGNVIPNTFRTSVDGSPSGSVSPPVNITVVEPNVAVLKQVSVNSGAFGTPVSGDAGDPVSYRVRLTNSGTATSFNTLLNDAIPSFITGATVSSVTGGGFVTGDFTISGGILQTTSPTGIDLLHTSGNNVVTIIVTGTLADTVNPGQSILNTANITYTSLPGTNGTGGATPGGPGTSTGERTGSGVGPNGYLSSNSATITVPKPTISKSLFSTTLADTTGNDVTIGESATFALLVTVPQGETPNLVVTDTLPAGMVFTGFTLVNTGFLGTGAVGTNIVVSNGTNPGNPFASGDDPVFTFTDPIVATGAPGTANNQFTIMVTARVENVPGNTGVPTSTALPDTASGSYGGTSPGSIPATPPVTLQVVEPRVVVTKVDSPTTGDAGDTITVTLTAQNTGNSISYDTVLQASLPPQYDQSSLVLTSTPAGFTGSLLSGVLTYSTDGSGTGGQILAGQTLTFTFTAVLAQTVNPGEVIENTWQATEVTTLPGVDPNERTTDSPEVTATVTVPTPTLEKSLFATSLPDTLLSNVNVGETATFALLITVPQGTIPGLVVTDTLPAGMIFTGFTVVNTIAGSGGLLTGNFNGSGANESNIVLSGGSGVGGAFQDGDDPVFTFTNSVVATGAAGTNNNQFLILVTARVADVGSNTRGQTLPDTASGSYTGTNPGPLPQTPPVTLTVTEPQLQVAKTVVGDDTLDGGATATYQLVISHTGLSNGPAYLLNIQDAIPAGLTFVTGSATIVSAPSASNAVIAINWPTLQVTADKLLLNETITITYQATVNAPGGVPTPVPAPGASITNPVTTDATSAPTNGRNQTTARSEATVIVNTNTVSGFVYVDADNDGTFDTGETPLGNVTVTLTGTDIYNQPVSVSTTTLADGSYQFTGLRPGTYTVTETRTGTAPDNSVNPELTLWSSYSKGFNTPGTTFGPATGLIPPTTQRPPTSTITPLTIPSDSNASGVDYNFAERINSDLMITKNSDASPFYRPNSPITYTIVVTNIGQTNVTGATVADFIPADILNPSWVTSTSLTGATVTSGVTGSGNNLSAIIDISAGAGNFVTFIVSGLISAAAVDILENTATVALPVNPNAPPDPTPENNTATVTDFPPPFPVPPLVTNRLTGRVYLDRNQNSKYEAAIDRPLAGITVTLRDSAGTVVATALTAADGTYRFANLPAGRYTITETQPTGFGSSQVPFNVRTVTMTRTSVIANQNFGDTLGNVSGKVYVDNNLNGRFSTNSANPDRGIRGITVTLTDMAGNPVLDAFGNTVGPVLTDRNGNYNFRDLLPGQYMVTETQPPLPTSLTNGFYDGADNPGSLSPPTPPIWTPSATKNSLSLLLGINNTPTNQLSQNGRNYNFGELPPADPFGFVYVDRNNNGRRDPGERGIAGVQITISGIAFFGTPLARPLVDADIAPGGSLTVRTDANGFYQFLVMPPGLYTIRQRQPAGFIDGRESSTDPNAPQPGIGNDVFFNLLLSPFAVRGAFNFGELLPGSTISKRGVLGSSMM